MAVLLLQQEQLLNASIDIGAGVIPRVAGVMLLHIRPAVGQIPILSLSMKMLFQREAPAGSGNIHLTSLRVDISKGVEDMGQFLRGQILRVVVAAVDRL